ncbi:MAG TPA: cytochrome P460 family protein [Methylococcaceae bacterium]|nr:cytochrome P460 family protein [Methylococcaceae bacterium]
MRAILGNGIAIDAARQGKTNPWPEGTIPAKLHWKQKNSDTFPTAIVPGEFVHAEFMIEDSEKYAATGGWGIARWLGDRQQPYVKDAAFVQECIGCHTKVRSQDFVFTAPVKLP